MGATRKGWHMAATSIAAQTRLALQLHCNCLARNVALVTRAFSMQSTGPGAFTQAALAQHTRVAA